MYAEKIEEMSDGKDKELLKLLNANAKPFMRKHDGYATKVDEDTEITFKNHDGQETSIKIPAGDYIKVDGDSCYPEIVTSESFEKRNKMVEGEKPKEEKKEDDSPKIGIATIAENN